MPQKTNTATGTATAGVMKKTGCPVTRATFREEAKPMMATLKVGDQTFSVVLAPKEFSTGSFGWANNDKATIQFADESCKLQLNCSIIFVGSKEQKD